MSDDDGAEATDSEPADEPVDATADAAETGAEAGLETEASPTEAEPSEPSEPPEPPTPEQRIAELEAALEETQREIQYKQADARNAAQRAARDQSKALRYGGAGLARRLIDGLEDLDRALAMHTEDEETEKAEEDQFVTGVRLARQKLLSALASEGVERIVTEGAKFDPTRMEAMATVPPSEGVEPGSVIEELEKGWMHHDRVLRAARVVVASE